MDIEDLQELRLADDYRSFLRIYLKFKSLSGGAFARQAGFVRQFPSDVLSGKRRLTLRSFVAFDNALNLPPMARKFFKYLVANEEKDLFPDLGHQHILTVLSDLRAQTWQSSHRKTQTKPPPEASILFRNPSTLVLISATGTPEKGASLQEIVSRSRLSTAEVNTLLPKLVHAKILRLENDRYFADDFHVFLNANAQKEAFSAVFNASSKLAAEKVVSTKIEADEMFFTSFFCIDRSKLPALKEELRKTLLQFVDNSMSSDADCVVRFLAALHL